MYLSELDKVATYIPDAVIKNLNEEIIMTVEIIALVEKDYQKILKK